MSDSALQSAPDSLSHPLAAQAGSALALLTAQQVRVVDALAAHQGEDVFKLMQRAGEAVAAEIMRRIAPCQVVVLVGPGNNGGDGLIAAAKLKEAGWSVTVALLGEADQLKGAAAQALAVWDGPTEPITRDCCDQAALVVDAVFGVGCERDIPAHLVSLYTALFDKRIPVVAVDIPSGIASNTGQLLGGAPMAFLTVTFARKKPGHLLLPGRIHAGEVVVADIGIAPDIYSIIQPNLFENGPELWLHALPEPQLHDHKYSRGVALIAGGAEMTGAARLAARAAQRAGAGMVQVAAPAESADIYRIDLESCIVHQLADAEAWGRLLATTNYSAICIGPGLGRSEDVRADVLRALRTDIPTVLDADGISSFAGHRSEILAELRPHTVMTPHNGEYDRLFDTRGDALRRACLAAVSSGSIVLLKGATTVIAAPDGTCILNTNAPPTLATAGAGDVLAGLITGLMAQGMPPLLAAAAGAWMHGAVAYDFGPGLIAEDLISNLPLLLNYLYDLKNQPPEAAGHQPPAAPEPDDKPALERV